MRFPNLPQLEFGLYFADYTGDESMRRVFRYLLATGGEATGAVNTHADTPRIARFASIYDYPLTECTVDSIREIEELMESTNARVVQVEFRNAIRLIRKSPEILTQSCISQESIANDHHPVAIWLDGSVFFRPPGKTTKSEKKFGKKVYSRFRKLVLGTNPSYAAMTIESGLKCPTDLRNDKKSIAFLDFYVSADFIGRDGIAMIRDASVGAFHEPLPGGLMTCCSRTFASQSSISSESAYLLSASVGRCIASIAKRK